MITRKRQKMKLSRSRVLSTLIATLLCAQLYAHPVPEDKALHKNPFFKGKQYPQFVLAPRDIVQYDLSLDKERYTSGETIQLRIAAANPADQYTVQFSPIYHGSEVATIGLWVSRWDEERQHWGDQVRIYDFHKELFPPNKAVFQGKPVQLAPGERWGTLIALNVMQPGRSAAEEIDRFPCWVPHPLFSSPGRYKLYIKYVSLESSASFASRGAKTAGIKPEPRPGHLTLSPEPLVFDPIELTVSEPDGVNEMPWLKYFSDWSEQSIHSGIATGLSPSTIKTPEAIELEKWKKAGLALDSYVAFRLMQVRSDLSAHTRSHDRDSCRRLLGVLDQLAQKDVSQPLKNHIRLLQCEVMWWLGQKEPAILKSKEIQTPDAEIWREDKAR